MEIKSRLSGLFLKVTIDNERYLCWYSGTLSIRADYQKKLTQNNKCLVFVERNVESITDINFQQYEVEGQKYERIWKDNNRDRRCREILIEKATEFHNMLLTNKIKKTNQKEINNVS